MCDYCGCREFYPISELHDDHQVILRCSGRLRAALGQADWSGADSVLAQLHAVLEAHDAREQAGLYVGLEMDGVAMEATRAEHRRIDGALSRPAPASESATTLLRALEALDEHLFTEEQDLFPYAYRILSSRAWDVVEEGHRRLSLPVDLGDVRRDPAPA